MTKYGTVVDKQVNVDIQKQDKTGSYKGYQIVYRDEQGKIETLAKTMQSLKYAPSVEAALGDIATGDDITIVQEKNAKGFLDVKALIKGKMASDVVIPIETTAASAFQGQTSSPNYAAPRTGKVIGSTYETPEERKLKQRLIVRQAALNQALAYFNGKLNSSSDAGQGDVEALATEFEAWVYRGLE